MFLSSYQYLIVSPDWNESTFAFPTYAVGRRGMHTRHDKLRLNNHVQTNLSNLAIILLKFHVGRRSAICAYCSSREEEENGSTTAAVCEILLGVLHSDIALSSFRI
jgi:hypothetical protein